eukprot:1155635-Pelagomonas_calceolata.AAC.17
MKGREEKKTYVGSRTLPTSSLLRISNQGKGATLVRPKGLSLVLVFCGLSSGWPLCTGCQNRSAPAGDLVWTAPYPGCSAELCPSLPQLVENASPATDQPEIWAVGYQLKAWLNQRGGPQTCNQTPRSCCKDPNKNYQHQKCLPISKTEHWGIGGGVATEWAARKRAKNKPGRLADKPPDPLHYVFGMQPFQNGSKHSCQECAVHQQADTSGVTCILQCKPLPIYRNVHDQHSMLVSIQYFINEVHDLSTRAANKEKKKQKRQQKVSLHNLRKKRHVCSKEP